MAVLDRSIQSRNFLRFYMKTYYLMVIVSAVALCLASLRDPMSVWASSLLYLKVALLVFAMFRARYGKGLTSAWWFGFAAFGFGHICLEITTQNKTVINSTSITWPANYRSIRDITGTLSVLYIYLTRDNAAGISPAPFAQVIREWMTIVLGVIGGFVSLAIAARSPRVEDSNRR